MICTSAKEGIECFFMSKNGCQYNGGKCHPVVDQCEGCEKAKVFPAGKYCLVFPDPGSKWRTGKCNMATHKKETVAKVATKLNPIKASKRKVA